MGLRLEKHLDKLREQYKAQKHEEETKRQFYHSPETIRREGVDGENSSEGMEGSMELSSHSEQTPEPSPALNQREEAVSNVTTVPAGHHMGQRVLPEPVGHHMGQRVLPEPAPKPKVAPQVAPRPSKVTPQANGSAPSNPTAAYNPYPAPTQAAPPSPQRHPSPQQPAPLPPPQAVAAPPTNVPPGGGDKEALFAFAWYHGSIPRDEALRRLEGVGGFDG